MYDPYVARWLGRDPFENMFPDDPPFSYSFNSPLRFSDPSGKCPDGQSGLWIDSKGDYGPAGMMHRCNGSKEIVVIGKKSEEEDQETNDDDNSEDKNEINIHIPDFRTMIDITDLINYSNLNLGHPEYDRRKTNVRYVENDLQMRQLRRNADYI